MPCHTGTRCTLISVLTQTSQSLGRDGGREGAHLKVGMPVLHLTIHLISKRRNDTNCKPRFATIRRGAHFRLLGWPTGEAGLEHTGLPSQHIWEAKMTSDPHWTESEASNHNHQTRKKAHTANSTGTDGPRGDKMSVAHAAPQFTLENSGDCSVLK